MIQTDLFEFAYVPEWYRLTRAELHTVFEGKFPAIPR